MPDRLQHGAERKLDVQGIPLPSSTRWLARTRLTLTDAEVATKGRALAEYKTQQQATAALLTAFVRRTEPFTVLTAAELRGVGQMIERRAAAGRGAP